MNIFPTVLFKFPLPEAAGGTAFRASVEKMGLAGGQATPGSRAPLGPADLVERRQECLLREVPEVLEVKEVTLQVGEGAVGTEVLVEVRVKYKTIPEREERTAETVGMDIEAKTGRKAGLVKQARVATAEKMMQP